MIRRVGHRNRLGSLHTLCSGCRSSTASPRQKVCTRHAGWIDVTLLCLACEKIAIKAFPLPAALLISWQVPIPPTDRPPRSGLVLAWVGPAGLLLSSTGSSLNQPPPTPAQRSATRHASSPARTCRPRPSSVVPSFIFQKLRGPRPAALRRCSPRGSPPPLLGR